MFKTGEDSTLLKKSLNQPRVKTLGSDYLEGDATDKTWIDVNRLVDAAHASVAQFLEDPPGAKRVRHRRIDFKKVGV